jgi:hypothetical protein
MTLSRDLSSSSFYSPRRASADLCLHIATMPLQPLAAALWTTFSLAGIPSRHSTCAASGILRVGTIGKTPFHTQ